jgi:hypothetical protein
VERRESDSFRSGRHLACGNSTRDCDPRLFPIGRLSLHAEMPVLRRVRQPVGAVARSVELCSRLAKIATLNAKAVEFRCPRVFMAFFPTPHHPRILLERDMFSCIV